MPYFIDTHCHLSADAFDKTRAQIIQNAQQVGVKWQLIVATHSSNFEKVLAISQQFQGIFPALGLHPYWIAEHQEQDLLILEHYLKKTNNIVAIGECGLDLWIDHPELTKQQIIFEQQCEMAQYYDLPLIIHARKAVDLVIKTLNKYPQTKGIVHSFSGSLQQAEKLIAKDFLLGFGGAMTYERANRLRHLVQELPASAIVIETDSPDQKHAGCHRAYHEPQDLIFIAQEVAKLRNQSLEDIANINTENIQRIFEKITIT